jgi:hypothetical protein
MLLLLALLVQDPPASYKLPWEEWETRECSQGFNGSLSHTGQCRYALDFLMPQGTKVLAARGGKVVEVKSDESEGGFDEKFKGRENRIRIDHGDATSGLYLHLKKDGALVKVGDTVKQGDLIGLSGATGYASAPHLHFQVCKENGWDSVEFKFDDVDSDGGVPVAGRKYVSKNGPGVPLAQKKELLELRRTAQLASDAEAWGLALPRWKKLAETKLAVTWSVIDDAKATVAALEKQADATIATIEKLLADDDVDGAVRIYTLARKAWRDTPFQKKYDALYGSVIKRESYYAALAKVKEASKAQDDCLAGLKSELDGKLPVAIKSYGDAAKGDSFHAKFAAMRLAELRK